MRKVISPNAYWFVQIKKSVTEGLSLAQQGGKPSELHTNPETRKLMQVYHIHQLHLFRSGIKHENDIRKVDDLGCDQIKLIERRLKAWIHETMSARLYNATSSDSSEVLADVEMDIDNLDQELAERSTNEDETRTNGHIIQTADRELIFDYGEPEDT